MLPSEIESEHPKYVISHGDDAVRIRLSLNCRPAQLLASESKSSQQLLNASVALGETFGVSASMSFYVALTAHLVLWTCIHL